MLLAHDIVASRAEPEPVENQRWMLFLHGILGRRTNWRSFSRRWVKARPGWGAVLVDLRGHGDSQGLPGPHTVAAAAGDLVELAGGLAGGRVAGVLGHSLGGKVAIAAAEQLRAAGSPLDELWIIDAPPGPRTQPRDRTTDRVFELLSQLPDDFASRAEFVDLLMRAGIAKGVSQWLATNLIQTDLNQTDGGRWRFALDLDDLQALLRDFSTIDLWPIVEAEADAGTRIGLVLGERSEAVFGEQLERAQTLADAGRLVIETIEGAGHWVHVDNPNALLATLEHPPGGA